MRQSHLTHLHHHRPVGARASSSPANNFDVAREGSEVVCPSCYRCVIGSPIAEGLRCPRCGSLVPFSDS